MKKISLFFLLLTSTLVAQQKVEVDLSNPNATIYTHLYYLQSDSYEPEKAAKTIYGFEGEEAQIVAIKLKKILDGKGLKVDFSKIPTNHIYADTTDNKVGYKYVLFPYQIPEIYVERIGDSWYYSIETTNKIDEIYNSVYPWFTEKLQQIIPEFGHKKLLKIELWQYLGLLVILFICVLSFYVLRKIVFYLLRKIQYWVIHKSNEKINEALKKLTRPIVLLLLIWFVKIVLPSLLLDLEVNAILFLALNIMVTIFWIYVFLKLVQVVMSIYAQYAESTHNKLDDQLVPILNNFLKGVVLFLGLLKMLTLFGVEPVTVIAGASIGGLAVALASQDTVKNLIGTVMIFIDKPFHIGDWIEAGEVVGTVETVGFRSTTVRAADTSVYQIPNSALAEMVVNNKGLRAYRRYKTNLGLRYDTPPELIEAFVLGVRKIIELHPATRDKAFNVEFTGFGDSALLILVNVYFTALDWNKEQASKHSLHIGILNLAKELGVDFAFPSTTVMIEQFPEKKGMGVDYDIEKKRIQQIIDTIK
jgi:MscS family membrane protein